MIESIATILAVCITVGIFVGPIVLVVFIIKKLKKAKNNKTTHQNVVQPISQPMPQPQMYNQQINELVDEKEVIDEYYQTQYIPYRPKYFLTKNELYFYKELKKIADEKNLVVLSKIRVADLVEVEPMDRRQWQTYFNKINKKHVDFALANPQNLQIQLLIELDDYSHNDKQYERDRFMEAVYKKTNYKLLRVKGIANLKENIEGTLNSF